MKSFLLVAILGMAQIAGNVSISNDVFGVRTTNAENEQPIAQQIAKERSVGN